MKPFLAAGLLDRGRVSDHDSVDTGDGVLELKGRQTPIRDEHLVGRAPLAEVLRWSSNVGIVKFSSRLNEREEFETLRDFGFGTQTGVPFPTESPGQLRPPKTWSLTSASSMAMGYEVSVTPLQLATAYAAFANGGKLIEPALVKQIIDADGSVRYTHKPRIVRQVVSRSVAEKMRHMLLDVVDEGTALEAALDSYQLAGKTGTPRATVRGRYVLGRYNPNFVGLFPGDNPQYVIVVKLTAPQTSIFAAKTAAPVTKVILEAAIAARNAALDRGRLASSAVPSRKDSPTAGAMIQQAGAARPATASAPENAGQSLESVPYVVTLPLRHEAPLPRVMHPIPDVRGLDLRDAVRSLHSAGFRVQLAQSSGTASSGRGAVATSPAQGELVPTGSVVRLVIDY
jgi:cell division protein FtsI (penicillin-binding protein 3)